LTTFEMFFKSYIANDNALKFIKNGIFIAIINN